MIGCDARGGTARTGRTATGVLPTPLFLHGALSSLYIFFKYMNHAASERPAMGGCEHAEPLMMVMGKYGRPAGER